MWRDIRDGLLVVSVFVFVLWITWSFAGEHTMCAGQSRGSIAHVTNCR